MHDRTFDEAAAIGARLRELMKAQGMTQADVADRVGVAQVTISRHMAGRHDTPVGMLARICEALGTTLPAVLDHVMPRSHEMAA